MGTRLKRKNKYGPAGRYAYQGLDRMIHEHARLSVLTSLITHSHGLTFSALRELCALTDGNLSRHLQVLEEAGLVSLFKSSDLHRPVTLCRVTARGRRRYMEYLAVLGRVISDTQCALRGEPAFRSALKSAAAS